MALVVAVVALAVAVAALITAVTRGTTKNVVSPTTTVAKACVTSDANAADFVATVRQSGHSAYQSDPVNVTGNGTYQLQYGPLSASDVARHRAITSDGWSLPGTSGHFNAQPRVVHEINVNGATYLRGPLIVNHFQAPCLPLRVWLQF